MNRLFHKEDIKATEREKGTKGKENRKEERSVFILNITPETTQSC